MDGLQAMLYQETRRLGGKLGTVLYPAAAVLSWGDTNLYRQTAGLLAADGPQGLQFTSIGGAGYNVLGYKRAGDTTNRLQIMDAGPGGENTGRIAFGPGGVAALDTNLYRLGASVLGSSGGLRLDIADAGKALAFGSAGDAYLYRDSAFWLRVANSLKVNGAVNVDMFDGQNKLLFGSAQDVGLYRSAAGVLKTDTHFVSGAQVHSNEGGAAQISLSSSNGGPTGAPMIYFGSALDTNLYRANANNLKTDSRLSAAGSAVDLAWTGSNFMLTVDGTGNQLIFNQDAAANFFRSAAGALATNGSLSGGVNGGVIGGNSTYIVGNNWITGYVAGNLRWDGTNWLNKNYGGNNGWGMIAFNGAGGGFDYFSEPNSGAVDRTYTPAQMLSKRLIQLDNAGKLSWYVPGSGLDGNANIYRSAAGTVRTDGSLQVVGSISINGGTSVLAQAGNVSIDYDGANYFLSTSGHNRLNFGGDSVANLYRSAAGTLKTDGILNAVGGLQVNGVPVTIGTIVTATSVAGLGTAADGKVGLLRLGSSPFDFITLVYDATYGHWVSPPETVLSGANSSNNSTSVQNIGSNWGTVRAAGALVAAGLTPQYQVTGYVTQSGTGEAMTLGLQVASQNSGAALGSSGGVTAAFGTAAVTPAASGTAYFLKGPWASSAVTMGTDITVLPTSQSGGTSNAKTWSGVSISVRWVA